MGRKPCSFKEDLNKGAWTAEEDTLLTNYIHTHGETGWRSLPKKAGLNRCGKSCRLRWLNYLRPDIKRGNISADEDELIIRMHRLLGNRWALIAGRLPGRTDNEIKNYWNTHLSKKIAMSNSTSTTHLPIQKWSSFSGIKKQSPCSQNSSADEGAEPCEMRCASDNEVSSGILEGMQAPMEAGSDVSKSWTQLLEDALMADDESNIILSSSRLNVSYPVDCNPFSLPCIDFGRIENFSIESLIQPGPYDILEDMCPTPLQSTHNNADCVAMADDEGIADALQQRQHCAEEASHMELDPLDELFYYDQEERVDFTGLAKISDEEYVDILVDNPK